MLLKSGEVVQAAAHYRKQLALNQEMVAADPANAQFRRNQAVALIKIGDVDARMGRTHDAFSNYNEALRIREQLSSVAPQDIYIQRDLAEVRSKLATLKAEH
jgi:tetratricopeptide (TPR) repeat protein